MPSDVVSALAGLDHRHRDVLVVLGLDGDPRRSTKHWTRRSKEAGVVDERGRSLSNEALTASIDQLVAVGAVRCNREGHHSIVASWLGPVLDDAHQRGRLVPLARGMKARGGWMDARGLGDRGELLVALASANARAMRDALRMLAYYRGGVGEGRHPLVQMLGLDIPRRWIELLEPAWQVDYVQDAAYLAFTSARRLGEGLREMASTFEHQPARALVGSVLALAGEIDRAHAMLDTEGASQWMRAARGFLALVEGKHREARERFAEAALGARRQRVDLPSIFSVFDVLLAVTSDDANEVADVARRMDKGRRFVSHFPAARATIQELSVFRKTGKRVPSERYRSYDWLDDFIEALGQRWMRIKPSRDADLEKHAALAREQGYVWLADEIERVRAGVVDGSLLSLFGEKEGWELVLDSLGAVVANDPARPSVARDKKATKKKKDAELWWTVGIHHEFEWVDVDASAAASLETKGKKLSWRSVLEDPGVPVTEQDQRIADRLMRMRDRGEYQLPCSVLTELVGHPRVRDVLGSHLTVEAGEPKLRVDRTRKGARVVLLPSRFDGYGTAVEREGDRLVLYTRTPVIARIAESLPPQGLEVPPSGLARMTEMLGRLGEVIRIETSSELASEAGAGDPRLHVQLFRASQGMRVRLRVVPIASGPALRPGAPPSETVVHRDGELVRVARDLAAEKARVEALLERCPTLASLPQEDGDLVARDLETCLELLVELREAETDAIVEWLEGHPLRAPSVRSGAHVRVRVKGDSKWLSVEGEVRVDEERVLDMRELLDAASRARGRFVPIGEDEWLALTDDIKKKLDALGRVQSLDKSGRISASLLAAMETMLEGFDVSFTEAVEEKRAALERARALSVMTPRDLQAELRDYQRDGFVFLARRTEAGLGACLADDMGLGKTVQALALLLHRRKKGPALVVAPTSVCRNWEDEARRFAPSLTVLRLAEGDRDEREAVVRDAKRADVVLVSYGLLTSEEKLLASRKWATVVFDEAHALKNSTSRRWAAARALDAEAFVALTGTPVENRAAELHSLFDILVPGMLGARATFDRVIGAEIAGGSREAAALLRQMVRPFVLRRTKAQVLSELPPKTEVLHVVPPTAEHFAFYEAVRRRAVEKIEKAKEAGGARASRVHIELLAEITRLRRAAIDPRLVGGPDAPPGAKLDALVELVTELRDEGRRALVFSQFLEVLDLARARLEERQVECLRLDGTMSESVRAEAVSSFQSGRGDVFLVSLKAGGVGMNLTAADVVILLDPWWNPAVEDQAAGRAHRIGQTRPVTVARIVTERTIEEKVIALHAKKRQLFDDVVADADGTGTLDVDTIAALLSEDAPNVAARSNRRGTPTILS